MTKFQPRKKPRVNIDPPQQPPDQQQDQQQQQKQDEEFPSSPWTPPRVFVKN